jgi:hypothetical protein
VKGEGAAAPPSAGGAAGNKELSAADLLVEPLAKPLAEPDGVDVEVRVEARFKETGDAVLLLTGLDANEDVPVADVASIAEVAPAPPVGMGPSVVLAGRTSELEGESWLTNSTMILISVH